MSELKAYSQTLGGPRDVYLKSEADAVIAELKHQIEFLKTTNGSCGNCSKCADGMDKVFEENFAELKADYKEACDKCDDCEYSLPFMYNYIICRFPWNLWHSWTPKLTKDFCPHYSKRGA